MMALNNTVVKHKGGRPPKYASPEDMQKSIEAYFLYCDLYNRPYTMCGLALALDISRMTLINYRNRNEEFGYLIKRARLYVEHSYEVLLSTGTKRQIRGAIFCLKANFGWHKKIV
jgi:hypothetical protein